MLMATPEASESVLAWSWVIGALAGCRVFDLDVLHDLIGANPNFSDNLGKEAREMVALRCLEALFDPAKTSKNGVSLPCSNQKEFQFDSSECFTGVLLRVLEQTSVSDLGKSSSNPLVSLRKDASDQLVREVNAFVEYRKSCLPKSALEQIWENILRFENDEFYIKRWPQLDGMSFGDVLISFPDAVPCGIKVAADKGKIILNPEDDYILQEEDEILVIAEDNDTYAPGPLPEIELLAAKKMECLCIRFKKDED